MKNSYWNHVDRSNITLMGLGDVVDLGRANCWLVTSVWVQPGSRGRGSASRLLKVVCDHADRERATLLLKVESDGTGLRNAELLAFYERNCFQQLGSDELSLVRAPSGG